MGSIMSYGGGIAASSMFDIDVPIDVVWETVIDVNSYPYYFDAVHSVKTPQEGIMQLKEGSTWDEVRIFKQRTFLVHKTVTGLVVEPDVRSLSLNSCFDDNRQIGVIGTVNTSTLRVERLSDDTCRLIASMAVLPGIWMTRLHIICCRSCIQTDTSRYFENEIQQIADEAIKRYQAR